MKRSKPLKRSGRLRSVNRKRGGKRFPNRVDKAYQTWVRSFPCFLSIHPDHQCIGDVEFAHVKSKGSGGDDCGNGLPLCAGGHRLSPLSFHVMGRHSFAKHWGVNLADIATSYGTAYHIHILNRLEQYERHVRCALLRAIAAKVDKEMLGAAYQSENGA